MVNWTDRIAGIEGEIVAVLLDQEEFPANIGNVAAVTDRQICYLKKDRKELSHYRYEFYDIDDCKVIEYKDVRVYYRMIIAGICFILAAILGIMLATGSDGGSEDIRALLIAAIALLTFGARFITSTHRHVINFEMPDQVLRWRSPAIDYKFKADAAHAVRNFARKRGILRE